MELYHWIVNHDEAAKINNLALLVKGETPVREMVLFYSKEVRNRILTVRDFSQGFNKTVSSENSQET